MSLIVHLGFRDSYGSWNIICIFLLKFFNSMSSRSSMLSIFCDSGFKKLISPFVFGSSKHNERAVVVLPQPDSPPSPIVLPAGTRVIGIVWTLRSSTDDTAYSGLFTYSPDYGGPDTVNATLRLLAQSVDDSGGASVLNDPQFFKADAAFASQYLVQEGDQLLPAFRRTSSSDQTVIGTFTIIVKY